MEKREEILNAKFWDAITNGDEQKVAKLLELGADINSRDQGGNLPLFIAVQKNEIKIANYLIKKGAKLNIKDNSGNTILHLLAFYCKKDCKNIIKQVIKKVDVNLQNNEGNTALHLAAISLNEDILRTILGAKPDLNLKNNRGDTALYNAFKYDGWGFFNTDHKLVTSLYNVFFSLGAPDDISEVVKSTGSSFRLPGAGSEVLKLLYNLASMMGVGFDSEVIESIHEAADSWGLSALDGEMMTSVYDTIDSWGLSDFTEKITDSIYNSANKWLFSKFSQKAKTSMHDFAHFSRIFQYG